MNQMGFEFDQRRQEEVFEDTEPQVLSVSELNSHVREVVEGEFPLIWVQGEISNFKAHTSGHHYFSLKDKKAQINAVMFRGFNSRLKFKPQTGMEVLIRGKITVYEPRGNYQLFCETMEPLGAGALQKAYEQLKEKLSQEGLFDKERKRAIPEMPRHIAVVTSPTGAAIRDILNVLRRRNRSAKVTVVPTLVQGEAAAPQIVKALKKVERLSKIKGKSKGAGPVPVDVVIVGRGGGSIEDMWCFNDESVARAIADLEVPVISAVGHEIDFTISDFVADLRAPTPSAAAELVVKNAEDILEKVDAFTDRLVMATQTSLENLRFQVVQIAKRLVDPQKHLQDLMMRADELTQRLEKALRRDLGLRPKGLDHLAQRLRGLMGQKLEQNQARLARQAAVLDSLSPLKVVERGYSIVTKNKKVIKDTHNLNVGDDIHLRLAHGEARAQITEVKP